MFKNPKINGKYFEQKKYVQLNSIQLQKSGRRRNFLLQLSQNFDSAFKNTLSTGMRLISRHLGFRHTSDFHKSYCHKKIKRHYHKEIKRHLSCNIIFSPCKLKICFWGQNMLVLKCNSNILTKKKCRFIFLSKYIFIKISLV